MQKCYSADFKTSYRIFLFLLFNLFAWTNWTFVFLVFINFFLIKVKIMYNQSFKIIMDIINMLSILVDNIR